MGTRGAIGFIVDGVEKVTYRHFDSYPSEGGRDVLQFIADTPVELMRERALAVQLVHENDMPSPAHRLLCKREGLFDGEVASQTDLDWYCLLRGAQGNLGAYLKVGVMVDSRSFLIDSLFCEWAYLINLDSGKLEVYRGFNQNRKAAGRYAKLKAKPWKNRDGQMIKADYCGVALIAEESLEDLRNGFTNRFGKLKPDELMAKLTDGWQRIAEDQREAEERVAKEKADLKKAAKALAGK